MKGKFSKALVLKLQYASEFPGGFKSQIAEIHTPTTSASPRVSDSLGIEQGPRIYISKFLGDADVAGLGTTLLRTTTLMKLKSLLYLPGAEHFLVIVIYAPGPH